MGLPHNIKLRDYLRISKILNEKLTYRQSCDVCQKSFAIGPDGNYYPCHMFMGFEGYEFNDSDSYLCVRSKLDKVDKFNRKECQECWIRNLCDECPASIIYNNNVKSSDFKYNCEKRKKQYESILLMIAEDSISSEKKHFNKLRNN